MEAETEEKQQAGGRAESRRSRGPSWDSCSWFCPEEASKNVMCAEKCVEWGSTEA